MTRLSLLAARLLPLTIFVCSACSSVDDTPTGAASASGVDELAVSSAYSVNVTTGGGQISVDLLAAAAGAKCGSVRGNPPSITIVVNADPNGVGGKTFPITGSASSTSADVLVYTFGDAGREIFVTGGTVTFDPASKQSDIKGTLSATTSSGATLTATFDAPACNDN